MSILIICYDDNDDDYVLFSLAAGGEIHVTEIAKATIDGGGDGRGE